MKKIPLRRCIVTKQQLPKNEMLRIVKTKDNEIFVDETGKLNGRGVYVKKDISVLEPLISKKILERSLETNIDESIYKEIENIIKNI